MSDLTFARVVEDAAAALELVLERELTGYAEFTPQDALLLDAEGEGRVAFQDGVPTHVEHTGTGRGGSAALADLAVPGPLRVECYAGADGPVPGTERFAVAPGTPAEQLAGDEALAARTRDAATAANLVADTADSTPSEDLDAVEAFLADEEKVAAIKDRAAQEAERRAEEWGFDLDDE